MNLETESERGTYSKLDTPQNNKYELDEMIFEVPNKSAIEQCTDQDFLDLLRVIKEDVSSWDRAGSGDNVTVYKKMTDTSPIVLVKAIAWLKGVTPEILYEVMSNQVLRR